VSLPESSFEPPRGVLVPKPRTTIYTVLLGLALVALAIGSAMLALEMWRYGFAWTPPTLR
jgi:hypothetical protein